MQRQEFLTRPLIFYRSYSRIVNGLRESWDDVCDRTLSGLKAIGNLTDEQAALIDRLQREYKTITSGRFLWVGGTKWLEDPANVYGSYNCSSTIIDSIHAIALQMELSMTGCGVGAILEEKFISKLPKVTTKINLSVTPMSVNWIRGRRLERTKVERLEDRYLITVGDSRQGWVGAYEQFMLFAVSDLIGHDDKVDIEVDLTYIRPKGEAIEGFGGVANASKLPQLWERLAEILNGAIGRSLTAEEVCLLIDEGLNVVVAGNIRRSAGIKQFDSSSKLLKTDLWSQDKDGNWVIDPKKDALRMSNHTRVYHKKPSRDECIDAVRSQYFSGEGAIQWAGEAVARANADILDEQDKKAFLKLYDKNIELAKAYLGSDMTLDPGMTGRSQEDCDRELDHRMVRYGLNPCGEVIPTNNFCNLAEVHLNMLDPNNLDEQDGAFYAAGVSTAVLLHHKFPEERYQYSRNVDPIVGVSFTGLFDFFVIRFGVDWLRWWEAGRPSEWGNTSKYECGSEEWDFVYLSDYFLFKEQEYLQFWKESAFRGVYEYCDRNGLRRPNRCTVVQPAGSKSLLTNASPGWHPPKASRYIRRMTFARDHSIASAAIAYGYSVIPSQSDKDENGQLLDDPFDPRCTEWLVEVPIETSWANLEGAADIDISKFSALAQFDLYMQVQKHYTTHNCFARDTEFLTDKGIRSFYDFNEGDVVIVLNKDGEWVESTVVKTEDQREMVEIVLREGKSGKTKKIVSTLCHRFPVKRASGGNSVTKIVKAEDLQVGHRFVVNSTDFDLIDLDLDGIRHGLVYGDGSLYRNNTQGEYKGSQLYLCGGKRHLVSFFEGYERTYERDDIDQTRIYGLPVSWKNLPPNDCSQSYLAGFIAGLLATDGNITNSTITISSSKQELVDFLLAHSPSIGLKICSYKWFRTDSYKEDGGAFNIIFSKSTFSEKLVLRPHHLGHFNSHECQPCQWKVVEINLLTEKQEGWCVMEPKTNHFTLSDNLLVMNTSATLEVRESEIELLGDRIYQAIRDDEGYVSCAILARYDDLQTFPRLPFEPIDKATYDRLVQEVEERRTVESFAEALQLIDNTQSDSAKKKEASEAGPAGCDSDKCLFPNAVVSG